MRLLIYFPTNLNSSAWEAVTPPTTMTLVWPPSENLMQAWFILATPILVRVQYSTSQCSTVQYSTVPGQSLPVELGGVAGGADPGVRVELVEVEVGGGHGLQVKVSAKFRGYFLIIRRMS